MRGRPHMVIGGAAGAAVGFLLHAAPLGVVACAAVGALGGLLPDIDHAHSTLGRYVPWPAAERRGRGDFVAHGRRWFGGRVVWHRGETHSVGAAAIAALGAAGITGWGAWRAAGWLAARGSAPLHPLVLGAGAGAALLAGYVSHLVADTVNRSPQMLWWPFKRRMVHPPWRGWPEASPAGRTAEAVGEVAAVLLAVALAIHTHTP